MEIHELKQASHGGESVVEASRGVHDISIFQTTYTPSMKTSASGSSAGEVQQLRPPTLKGVFLMLERRAAEGKGREKAVA